MGKKYVAYVGSYTYIGNSQGITIYDVDTEKGVFVPRKEIAINNSSYISPSLDGSRLFSIADDGIVSYRIQPDGDLQYMGTATIRGMRGCHISTNRIGSYMFISGYHDGKVTTAAPAGSQTAFTTKGSEASRNGISVLISAAPA